MHWETATELVGASCDLTGGCSGTAVCGIWYDVWTSGLTGPYPICEWHVHDMLTHPAEYDVMRYVKFVRLSDTEPWLPPTGMTEHEFYEAYPGPRYHPAIAPADLGSWSPPPTSLSWSDSMRCGETPTLLEPAEESFTARVAATLRMEISPNAGWVRRIILIMVTVGLLVKAVTALRAGSP